MKIGFVSRAFPHDPEKLVWGFYKRMAMFIDAFKDLGELDMLFFVNPEMSFDSSYVNDMENKLAKHWGARLRLELCKHAPWEPPKGRWQEYVSPALSIVNHPPYQQYAQKEQISAVQRLFDRSPDIVFVHRLTCMTPLLLSKHQHPEVYFDMDDIEHIAFLRSIKHPPHWRGKPLLYLRLPVLRLFEKHSIQYSHRTFVCSDIDKAYLSRTYRCNNVAVIPNAIDIPQAQVLPEKPALLFLGIMSYTPNTVAADYLIKSIWPIILSVLPHAKLLIAGAYPERIPAFSDQPSGVEFLGFVDDLEKLYSEVRVVCCPILAGGGTRIKILEAAAYGKPVVSTTIGSEGIDLKDGESILLRDDPKAFAEACIRLLKDHDIAVKIGTVARSVVSQRYDRNSVISTIKTHLTNSRG